MISIKIEITGITPTHGSTEGSTTVKIIGNYLSTPATIFVAGLFFLMVFR